MLSIPFDPALVLGNLVDDTLLKAVLDISAAAAPADAAQDALNSLILSKRSIDMTILELAGMGVDTQDVVAASAALGTDIAKAAVAYAQASVKAQQDIIKAKSARAAIPVSATMESPIDYNKTVLKPLPLSSDSIKLDAQYFSNDENEQGARNTAATIKDYVTAATSFLGTSRSMEIGSAAQSQVARQYANHSIAGTLVITAGCTHKGAIVLAPLVIDPDKAIRTWNGVFPDDRISTDHPEQLVASVMSTTADNDNALKIISGATYGSSFVGMVHVLKTTTTETSQSMYSTAENLQAVMKTGGWFADAEGGFGVSSSFTNDVKRMLSMQQISSHCSVLTTGSIPSIKANDVKVAVMQFAQFDPAEMMTKLATMQNLTAGDMDSVNAAAASARAGGQMLQIQASKIQSVMTGLSEIDDGKNKMLDINSLMTAFEDYVTKALAGNIGVPINYYLKQVPKAALAHLWVSKYYPQYLAIREDDSAPSQTGAAPATAAPAAAAPAAAAPAAAARPAAAPAAAAPAPAR